MGIMVYSLIWVVQDLYHQPYHMQVGLEHYKLGTAPTQSQLNIVYKPLMIALL